MCRDVLWCDGGGGCQGSVEGGVASGGGAWGSLCICACETFCERPSGMSFICVVIGEHIG